LLSGGVALAEKSVAISECGTTIAEPGHYKLMNDLVDCAVDGVVITASDIVLDLNGHSISCDTQGGLVRLGGVVVWSPDWVKISNVTVRNGHVSDCSDGIVLVFTENSRVKNISAEGNLAWEGASGTGITVWYSENARITKNHTYDNEQQGIGVWDSTGTLVKHNLTTANYAGIWTERVDDTEISCNKIFGNGDGVLLGPWSFGGLVKGNLAKWNWFSGISAWGWGSEQPWDAIAFDNVLKHNVSEENPLDHAELAYDFNSGAIFPHPDGVCRNLWFENQFSTSWGPDNCINQPVELSDDDVCALDDESDFD
jgi:parallel beta-helix repeat protein